MSIKTLPIIASTNWGDPLVSYLNQTINNKNGGTLNSFDQWSQRPTNLTAYDQGLTLLYTRTGNFHEWTGTKWKVLSYGMRNNILDYGDAGSLNGPDLSKDDTAIFIDCLKRAGSREPALDGINNNGHLYLPPGHYRIQAELDSDPNIVGDEGKTFIYAIQPDGYAFTKNNITCGLNFINLVFCGDGGPAGKGVKFANGMRITTNSYDLYFDKVTFQDCKIGLAKGGALFTRIYDCKFLNNDVGVKAICEGQGHSGFDFYRSCIFSGHETIAVYYNQAAGSFFDENNTVFEHCKFNDNKGATIFAGIMGLGTSGLTFKQCIFENNAQKYGQFLSFDGQGILCTEIFFRNARGCLINCSTPNGITLQGTFCKLKLDGTNIDSVYDKMIVDQGCLIDYRGGDSKGLTGDYIDNSKTYFNSNNNEFTLVRTSNHRGLTTRNVPNLVKYGTLTTMPEQAQVDNGATAQVIISEGLYDNKCIKVLLPNNLSQWRFLWTDSTSNHKKYLFFSFAIKSNNSETLKIGIGFDNIIKKDVTLKNNLWQTYNGICTNANLDSYFRIVNNSTVAAEVLISKLQIVEFDTFQQASDYFKSDIYAIPDNSPLLFRDQAIPTSGKSRLGDILYNTNPIIGTPVGWICTTAGTPGTYKSMGNIISNITTNLPKISTDITASTIMLTYQIELKTVAIPPVSAFTLSGGKTISSITISDKIVTLNLASQYTIDDNITVSYTSPNSNVAIQDQFNNSALSFTNLYTIAGLVAVDLNIKDEQIVKSVSNQNITSYTLSIHNYARYKMMSSNQKMVGDGTVEIEVDMIQPTGDDKTIYLGLANRPSSREDANTVYYTDFVDFGIYKNGYDYNYPQDVQLPRQSGDKVRIQRLSGTVKLQVKRLNTNTWIDAKTLPTPITGTLYLKIKFEHLTQDLSGNTILTVKNIFGIGLS
ncbi:MAG: hypothetical protein H7196_00035 [candidate division SR1 bacterium]|nr:hypothetical protein [candidate division SR1 bacterium]